MPLESFFEDAYFDTSYKGWKQLAFCEAHSISEDFDTSYKGWKPPKHPIHLSFVWQISILPIRDGNTAAYVVAIAVGLYFDTSYKGWKRYY